MEQPPKNFCRLSMYSVIIHSISKKLITHRWVFFYRRWWFKILQNLTLLTSRSPFVWDGLLPPTFNPSEDSMWTLNSHNFDLLFTLRPFLTENVLLTWETVLYFLHFSQSSAWKRTSSFLSCTTKALITCLNNHLSRISQPIHHIFCLLLYSRQ